MSTSSLGDASRVGAALQKRKEGYSVNDRLRTACKVYACAALVAAFASSLSASPPPKPAAHRTVKAHVKTPAPVRTAQTVATPRPTALTPWPPPADKPGSPIMPTAYPNVWVRFTPSPKAPSTGDKSIYVMPGSSLSPGGMVPRAPRQIIEPVAIPLPGGGFAMKVDDSRTEYLVATRDATGKITMQCQSPAEAASKGGTK